MWSTRLVAVSADYIRPKVRIVRPGRRESDTLLTARSMGLRYIADWRTLVQVTVPSRTLRHAVWFLYALALSIAIAWYWRERHYESFLAIIGALVAVVSILDFVLNTGTSRESEADHEGGHPEEERDRNVVKDPAILWATAPMYLSSVNASREEQILRESFPSSRLQIEKGISATCLRSIMTGSKFDVVVLNVLVEPNGDVVFGRSRRKPERMPGEGLARLLELAGVRLLILATCNSVPLAARLAHRVNMIAATGTLELAAFESWLEVFVRLLAAGHTLSGGFEVSRQTVEIGVSLIPTSNPSVLKFYPRTGGPSKVPAQPLRCGMRASLRRTALPFGLAGLALLISIGVDRTAQRTSPPRKNATAKSNSTDQSLLTVRVVHPMSEEPVVDAEVVVFDSGQELFKKSSDIHGLAQFDLPEGRYLVVARFQQMHRGEEVVVTPRPSEVVLRLAKP